jgi:hypothetical protein
LAKPGAFKERYCKGRLCVKCGKCRDWYYTGDTSNWQWIRNVENWKDEHLYTWYNDSVWKRFKKRDGAKCRDHRVAVVDVVHFDYAACLCEDNIQNAL